MLWAGYIMSTLPVLKLLMSAVVKFMKPTSVVEGFAHLGLFESLAFGLGILEITCTVVYVSPRTSILGAARRHLRVGDAFIPRVNAGVFVWDGLFLREPRLRVLIPLKR